MATLSHPSLFRELLSKSAPVALTLLPILRRRLGWRLFSIPSVALFGGLWLLGKKMNKPLNPRPSRGSDR
jgi:hypothetical protein